MVSISSSSIDRCRRPVVVHVFIRMHDTGTTQWKLTQYHYMKNVTAKDRAEKLSVSINVSEASFEVQLSREDEKPPCDIRCIVCPVSNKRTDR